MPLRSPKSSLKVALPSFNDMAYSGVATPIGVFSVAFVWLVLASILVAGLV
jgi:hypothetical protein